VALHHAQRIVRVDPEIVIVAMRRAHGAVGLSAVGRFIEAGVEDIHSVLGLRIGIDAGVVKRPLAQAAILADQLPVGAAVVGAEHAAVIVLHNGIDAAAAGAGNRTPDLADDALGHARIA